MVAKFAVPNEFTLVFGNFAIEI
jgi:hypothetical protein